MITRETLDVGLLASGIYVTWGPVGYLNNTFSAQREALVTRGVIPVQTLRSELFSHHVHIGIAARPERKLPLPYFVPTASLVQPSTWYAMHKLLS